MMTNVYHVWGGRGFSTMLLVQVASRSCLAHHHVQVLSGVHGVSGDQVELVHQHLGCVQGGGGQAGRVHESGHEGDGGVREEG